MVTANDILTEISNIVTNKFTGMTIYNNSLPSNYEMPALLIKCTKQAVTDGSRNTVQCTLTYTITCYIDVNSDYVTSSDEILYVKDELLKLFQVGFINVSHRALKVKSSTGVTETGEKFVELSFDYYDDRSDAVSNDIPLMGMIQTKFKED